MYSKKKLSAVLAAACLVAMSQAAQAEVVVGGSNGWEVGFDGNVNGFLVSESQDTKPTGAIGGNISSDEDSARVRTGLLPAVFGFNVRSPVVNGLKGSARIGIYPQIQNSHTKNQFGSQMDLREAFFKVDGNFGSVTIGRSLALFQSKNLLTDMTLFGVGVQGGVSGGGTTLGRIGYGYIYANFNGGMRYDTPSMNGFKAAVGIYDPSVISGDVTASETSLPAFEAELSYATELSNGSMQAWLSGLNQSADFAGTDESATASGVAYGVQFLMSGFEFTASGYTGKALGSTLMLDTDSLDSTGKERDNDGFIVQGGYTFGSTKFGLSYGESNSDETSADAAERIAGVGNRIAKQSAVTFGIYHDVNKWLKVVGEYTRATNEWHGLNQDQEADLVSVGAFFMW